MEQIESERGKKKLVCCCGCTCETKWPYQRHCKATRASFEIDDAASDKQGQSRSLIKRPLAFVSSCGINGSDGSQISGHASAPQTNNCFGDGTFQDVLELLYQLYTVHCQQSYTLHILYAILPNKHRVNYVQLLQMLA